MRARPGARRGAGRARAGHRPCQCRSPAAVERPRGQGPAPAAGGGRRPRTGSEGSALCGRGKVGPHNMWAHLLQFGGALLFLSISSVAAQTCEQTIQEDCLNDRTTWQACDHCAEAHQSNLRKACPGGSAQVERFCKSTKPVIGGFDVVQYFSLQPGDMGVMGKPEFKHNLTSDDHGSPRFSYEFWFANEANRLKFALDPWKYAPKNGGF
jgi:hypothetical protein